MAVSVFKAHALEVLDRVAKSRECVVVTRRGRPLAQVVPCQPRRGRPVPGRLSHALVLEKDIVSPLGARMWEAAR